ncbi:MAG: hypothetical protein KDA71_26075, partial [Planctomycetales bacterium]|nr:hypothetical protein [Planctomycetales bacterium]
IMPMHYADPDKWAVLLGKRDGFGNTPTHVYYNEVCGEGYDSGAKLVTKTEIMRACRKRPNKLSHAEKIAGNYIRRIVSVDWGGGGQDMNSFTVVAVLGITASGRIDVLFGHRFRNMHNYAQEAQAIVEVMRRCRCEFIVHDFGGRGDIREHLLINAGVPRQQLLPIAYVGPTVGSLLQFKPEDVNTGQRQYYQCDKARSLVLTCQLIRYEQLRFFEYDYRGSSHGGLLHDFLALIEDTVDSPTRSSLLKIIRDPKSGPDDFAQAVNIGCMALFYLQDAWPDLGAVAHLAVNPREMEELSPTMPSWDQY